jgi:TetR/AcrR family transcriptional regulator
MPPREVPEPGPASDAARHKRDAVATQARLLDAAEREFAQRGYAGARLKDIASRAGVQTTLIHHYFHDKGGLYRSVLERALLPTQTESWNLLRENRDLEGLVRGFVSMLTRFYARHGNLLAILRHEAVTGSEVLPEILRERLAPLAAAVIAIVTDMQERGEIRGDIEPRELVVLTLSMAVHPFVDGPLLGVVLPGAMPAGDADLARRQDAITTLLLRALSP